MKILILGGNGMVGSNLYFSLKDFHEVYTSTRRPIVNRELATISKNYCIKGVDASNLDQIDLLIDQLSPLDVIINCIGVTKQNSNTSIQDSIYINSLFPHLLHKITLKKEIRLIHFSTDCVFSGRNGNYSDTSVSDAEDIYGRTKFLGELQGPRAITLRKSTIGLELESSHGLIEWWLRQKGQIKGFNAAIYTGVITSELANIVLMLLQDYPELEGLYNVSSEPISKFKLLTELQSALNRKDIEILKDESFICDRSLDGSEFKKVTSYVAPSWNEMIHRLSKEIKLREKLKNV